MSLIVGREYSEVGGSLADPGSAAVQDSRRSRRPRWRSGPGSCGARARSGRALDARGASRSGWRRRTRDRRSGERPGRVLVRRARRARARARQLAEAGEHVCGHAPSRRCGPRARGAGQHAPMPSARCRRSRGRRRPAAPRVPTDVERRLAGEVVVGLVRRLRRTPSAGGAPDLDHRARALRPVGFVAGTAIGSNSAARRNVPGRAQLGHEQGDAAHRVAAAHDRDVRARAPRPTDRRQPSKRSSRARAWRRRRRSRSVAAVVQGPAVVAVERRVGSGGADVAVNTVAWDSSSGGPSPPRSWMARRTPSRGRRPPGADPVEPRVSTKTGRPSRSVVRANTGGRSSPRTWRFYSAFEARRPRRDGRPMRITSDAVSCTHPGSPTLRGWSHVGTSWRALHQPRAAAVHRRRRAGPGLWQRGLGRVRREHARRRRLGGTVPALNLFVQQVGRWASSPTTPARSSARLDRRVRRTP